MGNKHKVETPAPFLKGLKMTPEIYKSIADNFERAASTPEKPRLTQKETMIIEFYGLFCDALRERISTKFDDARYDNRGSLTDADREDILDDMMCHFEDMLGNGEASKKAWEYVNKLVDVIADEY